MQDTWHTAVLNFQVSYGIPKKTKLSLPVNIRVSDLSRYFFQIFQKNSGHKPNHNYIRRSMNASCQKRLPSCIPGINAQVIDLPIEQSGQIRISEKEYPGLKCEVGYWRAMPWH